MTSTRTSKAALSALAADAIAAKGATVIAAKADRKAAAAAKRRDAIAAANPAPVEPTPAKAAPARKSPKEQAAARVAAAEAKLARESAPAPKAAKAAKPTPAEQIIAARKVEAAAKAAKAAPAPAPVKARKAAPVQSDPTPPEVVARIMGKAAPVAAPLPPKGSKAHLALIPADATEASRKVALASPEAAAKLARITAAANRSAQARKIADAEHPGARLKVPSRSAEARAADAASSRAPRAATRLILDNAAKGKLPPLPNFEANTHKPYRKLLARFESMVKARDLAGLEAAVLANDPVPRSTSPKAVCRYRDAAIIALRAQGVTPAKAAPKAAKAAPAPVKAVPAPAPAKAAPAKGKAAPAPAPAPVKGKANPGPAALASYIAPKGRKAR